MSCSQSPKNRLWLTLALAEERNSGQKTMKNIMVMVGLALVLLTGYMSVHKPKLFPFPPGEITVVGNVIYCGAKPFAELMYLELFHANNIPTPLSEATRGSGLVMYYYHNDREVWIHPEEGLSIYRDGTEYTKIEDMNRVWREYQQERKSKANQVKWARINIGGRPLGKEDMIRSAFYEARISADGRYVSYKTQGMIFDSSHEYLVECGLVK